jgi:hypothetical protein
MNHRTYDAQRYSPLDRIDTNNVKTSDIAFAVQQQTPMILMLNVHPSRARDLLTPDDLLIVPKIQRRNYRDLFGNVCTRILAPVGQVELRTNFSIRDSGQPDEIVPTDRQHPVDELPEDVLVFLLGSRYCETQKLSDFAWQTFGSH